MRIALKACGAHDDHNAEIERDVRSAEFADVEGPQEARLPPGVAHVSSTSVSGPHPSDANAPGCLGAVTSQRWSQPPCVWPIIWLKRPPPKYPPRIRSRSKARIRRCSGRIGLSWPPDRRVDIGSVTILAFDIGHHVGRRDLPHGTPDDLQLARPIASTHRRCRRMTTPPCLSL